MAGIFPFFNPLASRSGVMPVAITGRLDGTIANTATTTFSFGGFPRLGFISRALVSSFVLPTSASAVTAVLQKYDAVSNSVVVLSSAVSLLTPGAVAREGVTIELLSSLTQAQRTLKVGDTLELAVTAAGTVTGQATGLICSVEVLVAE
jgi:hypothetical protein